MNVTHCLLILYFDGKKKSQKTNEKKLLEEIEIHGRYSIHACLQNTCSLIHKQIAVEKTTTQTIKAMMLPIRRRK